VAVLREVLAVGRLAAAKVGDKARVEGVLAVREGVAADKPAVVDKPAEVDKAAALEPRLAAVPRVMRAAELALLRPVVEHRLAEPHLGAARKQDQARQAAHRRPPLTQQRPRRRSSSSWAPLPS
jgi:hypothetical protein